MPWFDLHNRRRDDGFAVGLDLHGRWQAAIGNVDGAPVGLSVTLPNYDGAVAPGESVTSPRAWTLAYAGDLDEMTNRLLDWQYRYLWDYTRAVLRRRADARLLAERRAVQPPRRLRDPTGALQKVFGLVDHMRHVGGEHLPPRLRLVGQHRRLARTDWRSSGDYLAKSGMRQLIYYPAYNVNGSSVPYQSNPSWFPAQPPSCNPVGTFGQHVADLSIPAAASWVQQLVTDNAVRWGDYMWRNDACPIVDVNGAKQLKQSEAFVRLSEGFLDARPGSTIQTVNSGGTELGWEILRRSSSASISDRRGDWHLYDATRLFPADKISGMPDDWLVGECRPVFNYALAFNPDFSGDSGDAADLECMRGVIERYRYLKAEGVAGRWSRVYHLDRAGCRAQLDAARQQRRQQERPAARRGRERQRHRLPEGPQRGRHLRGLLPAGGGHGEPDRRRPDEQRITLSSPAAGEIVWLGMPKRPGGGGDTTAPSAPASVTAAHETNMNVPGVGVTWPAASDDTFLSGYDVLRDGARIAVVSKGTYYFDHSPAASPQSTYAVRAFDGDGNRGATVSTTPAGAEATVLDGTARAIAYDGGWSHQTGRVEAYDGTLSVASAAGATATLDFTGSGIAWYAKLGPDNGKAVVRIDGGQELIVDLYAPDDNNWRVPIFSRTWSSTARHRITIAVLGRPHAPATGTDVTIDGFQVRTTQPTVTEDGLFTYGGTGWLRPGGGQPWASSESVTASGAGGDYDFAACRTACRGFSLTQGSNGWSYQDLRSGRGRTSQRQRRAAPATASSGTTRRRRSAAGCSPT